jgi:Fuc2NAc and GlcNAc transferase
VSAVLLAAVFLATVVGTGALRRYALARQVIDVPNARSSHRMPTARGGGAAIVLTYLAAIMSLTAMGVVASRAAVALIAGGAIVALVGFIDDHSHIPARWRLLAHYSAAFIAIIALQSWTLIGGDTGVLAHIVASLVLATALVWLLNLYNFMDGSGR